MKIYNFTDSNKSIIEEFANIFDQSKNNDEQKINIVKKIIQEVKDSGDQALINLSNKFDNCNFLDSSDLTFDQQEINDIANQIDQDLKNALDLAYQRIYDYHQKQLPQDFYYQDQIGVNLGNKWQSISKVAVYAPGGSASYPSSVLMCAVPALVAGVDEIILLSPCQDNKINPAILYTAKLCNINKIYKIGGAQAIAAACYGTKTIEKVDKIVGPGNSYVAIAKKEVYGDVGIDMIAGPTDLTIIVEKNYVDPSWVAADALSQLEHGPDSKSFIITDCYNYAEKIAKEITKIKESLPRLRIIDQSIKNSSIIIVDNVENATEIVNMIAPEHLEIISSKQDKIISKIKNAGAIFLGKYTPEAIGDYIAGPSHTLPTESNAKFSSGLSVYDFLKRISIIECSKNSFFKISNSAEIIAENEGLHAHKTSLNIRNDE